jgi:hypothetical protein
VSDGPVGLPVESGGVHLVAILEFDSAAAIQQALASPEGRRRPPISATSLTAAWT